jgi:hypothetical protein
MFIGLVTISNLRFYFYIKPSLICIISVFLFQVFINSFGSLFKSIYRLLFTFNLFYFTGIIGENNVYSDNGSSSLEYLIECLLNYTIFLEFKQLDR